MKKLAQWILLAPQIFSLFGTLLGIIGGYYSIKLYQNLRTEVQELLPTTARSVLNIQAVSQRLESIENLAILVFSEKTQASQKFVIDLAEKLKQLPSHIVASVDYRIDQELEFFKKRQVLFMDLNDLLRVKHYIQNKIQYEQELYNPLNLLSPSHFEEPQLDFLSLKKKYVQKTSTYESLPGGFYATQDETKRVLLVNRPGGSTGIATAKLLKQSVQSAIYDLKPERYAADLQIKYTGGVEDTLEEQEALVADLELSTIIVIIIVSLAMLFFYQNILCTFALMLSLIIGTLWTFGLTYWIIGYLNANSAFLGSIIIGNGINFGIIYLARYLEERQEQNSHEDATQIAMTHTARSTWTAALAAGLSYGSLMLTGFRGFNQFGAIGLMGMILCWLSAFTVLPAFLTLLHRRNWLMDLGKKRLSTSLSITEGLAKLIDRFTHPIIFMCIGMTLFSLISFSKIDASLLETNLNRLRNRYSIEQGSFYLGRYLDEIFQRYLSPLVILPETRSNSLQITQAFREKKEKEGASSLIASIQTLDDFIPQDQMEKIAILREIKHLLPKKIFFKLSESEQNLIQSYLTPEALIPFSHQDLPPMILRKFTEKDGTLGKMILIEPPLTSAIQQTHHLVRFVKELRQTADNIEPQIPIAGSLTVTADMIDAISQDGPKATLFSLLAVVLLVILLFRKIQTVFYILIALFLGIIWLTGMMLWFQLKINFLNFIALPITFGIGVDYAVNIFHRYQESQDKNILKVIQSTGGAVGLCSFSTIVGYMSLLIASNQGFVSFGALAVGGEITCLLAAMVALPAYLHQRTKRISSIL